MSKEAMSSEVITKSTKRRRSNQRSRPIKSKSKSRESAPDAKSARRRSKQRVRSQSAKARLSHEQQSSDLHTKSSRHKRSHSLDVRMTKSEPAKRSKQPLLPKNDKYDELKKEASLDRKRYVQHELENGTDYQFSNSFDRTQWENTKWNDKADQMAEVPADLVNSQLAQPAVGAVPGENFQNAVDHGQYLLDFPISSISVDFAEIVVTLIGIVLSLVGTQMQAGASYLLIVNAIFILLLLIALIVIQWRAIHVNEEADLNEKTRYFIDSKVRRYIAAIHLLRLMLVGSLFSILVYYAACGDHALKIREKGICKKIEASGSLFIVSAVLFAIQTLLIIFHLVFYFRNRLSVRACN